MNVMYGDKPRMVDQKQSRPACLRRLPSFASVLAAAVLGISLVAVTPARAATLDEGLEQYRSHLIADVDRTLASAQTLRASAAAGDVAAAKRAWLDARVGWERSEVFTGGFVPELDRAIDAWPNGAAGFHAIEAKLFGASRTDFADEANELVHNLSELSAKAHSTPLTPQGLLDGVVRLAYEVGESKVDGGESRVSGTSLDDMRNNVDGIELAWRTIFSSAVEARDRRLDADLRRNIDALKAMIAGRDLRRIDPDKLRTATEELVLRLQNAAPLLDLKQPTLEADAL
jgi:iron uptake system EfeUOB component EfeO/EfeM